MSTLKRCPFCGSTILLEEMSEMIDCIKVKVRCIGCGMYFTHYQHFSYSKSDRVALNDSFGDVWNRTRYIERQTETDGRPSNG